MDLRCMSTVLCRLPWAFHLCVYGFVSVTLNSLVCVCEAAEVVSVRVHSVLMRPALDPTPSHPPPRGHSRS